MYDGFKILNLSIDLKKLLDNPLLIFPGHYNQQTGEPINHPQTAKHKGLIFTIKNNNCRLKGSTHKFFNNGLHNWNDFYFSHVFHVLVTLFRDYEINPLTAVLNSQEIGVNITIPFDPQLFFNTVISHGGIPFHPFTNIEGAKGIVCTYDQYYIKIYDKSNQYPEAPEYILRFELSSRKMDFFKGRIKTLSDYLNPDHFIYFSGLLQNYFDEILTCDYKAKPKKLTQQEQSLFDRGTNIKYWENLKPDSKKFILSNQDINYKRARKAYYDTLDDFKKLIERYNCNEMQNKISKLIRDKLLIINDYTIELGDKMTTFLNLFTIESQEQNDILGIMSICPPSKIIDKNCSKVKDTSSADPLEDFVPSSVWKFYRL